MGVRRGAPGAGRTREEDAREIRRLEAEVGDLRSELAFVRGWLAESNAMLADIVLEPYRRARGATPASQPDEEGAQE